MMPPTTDQVASNPETDPATTAGHPDGCPACVSAVAEPWAVAPLENGSTLEHYQCPVCDYRWYTSWIEGGSA